MTAAREDREGQGGSWHNPHKIASPRGNARPSLTLPVPLLTCGSSEPPTRPSLPSDAPGAVSPDPPLARAVRSLRRRDGALRPERWRNLQPVPGLREAVMNPAVAAQRRLRRLNRERAAVGDAEFERRQLQRQRERIERCRERTRAAVLARQHRQPEPDCLPFEGTA